MSNWVLVQVILNLIFLTGIVAAWIRMKRPTDEDPKLSRGLQLLQSKIAILEDLSDRTDTQVKQLNALLETKCLDIQSKINDAEMMIRQIEGSRQKSMEIAKLFEDKIPHQEIVERQNTVKYVKAARLAHQGMSIPEILKQVDLSQAEVEFIAKVNRDQLMFSEQELPAWIQEKLEAPSDPVAIPQTEEILEIPKPMGMSQDALKKLGDEFQKAVSMAAKTNNLAVNPKADYQMSQQSFIEIDLSQSQAPVVEPASAPKAPEVSASEPAITTKGKSVQIRPVAFPRISVD